MARNGLFGDGDKKQGTSSDTNILGGMFSLAEGSVEYRFSARIKHAHDRALPDVDHINTPTAPVPLLHIVKHSLGNKVKSVLVRGCIIRSLHSLNVQKSLVFCADMKVIACHRL